MKQHPHQALSAARIRAVKDPGRYADGNGLYLIVDPSGAKRWLLRTIVRGKRCDIGFGGLKVVSLAEAREKAASYRKLARNGGDPLEERRKQQLTVPTFAEAARRVHAEHGKTWRNAKHGQQWINTLDAYVFPVFGDRPVHQIETSDVLRALSPIWLTKPETARRVRQRIRAVLDWAKVAGSRSGDNPVEGVGKGLPKQHDRDDHHAALPYEEVPRFIVALRKSDASEPARLAFEFLILTATRTSEVLKAPWAEFDAQSATWTIPTERTKPKSVRIAFRCRRAVSLSLHEPNNSRVRANTCSRSIHRAPMSNMVFLMMLRRMELEVTAHGFRSSFRDWASERTQFRARGVRNRRSPIPSRIRPKRPIRRGDLFEKRGEWVTAWERFATSKPKAMIGRRETASASAWRQTSSLEGKELLDGRALPESRLGEREPAMKRRRKADFRSGPIPPKRPMFSGRRSSRKRRRTCRSDRCGDRVLCGSFCARRSMQRSARILSRPLSGSPACL